MKKVLVILFIGIAIAMGGYYFTRPKSVTPTTSVPQPTPNILASGSSFLDPSGVYGFLYPSDFKLDTQDSLHPRIYKYGPTQKGQTEMYDGVLMVFEVINLKNQSLRDWVYLQPETADLPNPISINNYQGFSYVTKGLGDSTHYVVQKDPTSKYAINITYMVADPTNVGFQNQVDTTLSTLNILK